MKNTFTQITIAALLSFSLFSGYSQEMSLAGQSGNGITITNTSRDFVSVTKLVDGKKMEDFSKSAKILTMEKGAPALPVFRNSVVVANEGAASLVVEYDSYEEFINVEVAPSKGSLKRNVNPADVPDAFGAAYQQDAFYPGNLAEVSQPFIFRDVRGVTVSFYPYQYNPVTKILRVYKNITARVVIDGSAAGANEKTSRGGSGNAVFNQMYSDLFLNPPPYQQVAEEGEMLIIAPTQYIGTIAPLAEWKRKKGISTTVVPLSETGSSAIQIKNYISNFYNSNPGLTYILLVGDHNNLPCYSYGFNGIEELWSDSYYAMLEGTDYYPEALVGRFSGTVAEVATMVNRTLEYETAPLEGDWMTRVAGIGSNEGYGYGDDGQPDWEHLRGIGNMLLDHGYTYINEFYDGSQGENDAPFEPQAYMIADAVNEGIGLLNYCGHGAQDLFVTGFFTTGDVMALENTGKYPFVVSVACNNGTFTQGTSLCEGWLNAKKNGVPTGAIAACGSSILMAWAEPMQTQDGMADLITMADPGNVKTTLGGLFYNGQMSMLEAYGNSYTAVEVMQTWVFFGDPSVVYRNQVSQEIVAEHVEEISTEQTTVTVSCDVEGAFVAITQNGEIIGTGIVDGGEVVIQLNGFTPGVPLAVTATMQNYTPYQGTIATGALGLADVAANTVALYPNPASESVTISLGTALNDAMFEIRDITGKLVYTFAQSMANGSHTVDTSKYASGVYLLTVKSSGVQQTHKFIIR